MIRLVRGGPEVPAAIIRFQTTHEPGNPDNLMERSPFLEAFICGKTAAIEDVWFRRHRDISEDEYRHAVRDQLWLREHQPDHPKADPWKPVDLRALPPILPTTE